MKNSKDTQVLVKSLDLLYCSLNSIKIKIYLGMVNLKLNHLVMISKMGVSLEILVLNIYTEQRLTLNLLL